MNQAVLARLDRDESKRRIAEGAAAHGLVRHEGFAFAFPGVGEVLVNMTHIETPLDPIGASRMVLEGRAQVDRLVASRARRFRRCSARRACALTACPASARPARSRGPTD